MGAKLGLSHRLKVLENTVLRKIIEVQGRKMDHGESCIMMNFTACILHLILFR
jgi:hypothetical protein